MKLALALCLVASVAFADAAKDALAKGRKFANQQKYKDAIAAFEVGLADKPDDPTLLAEAGFAAYLDKDYVKAETLTRKSLDRQATPGVRGATLYNLGMIREARGDKAGAIAAYKESVKARPHRVVRAALAKLDPAAAAAADELVPARFDGPYADVPAMCKALAAQAPDDACTCGGQPVALAGTPIAPFEKLTTFTRSCNEGTSHEHVVHLLATKLATGWYVFQASDNLNTLKCEDTTAMSAFTVVGPTLRVPIEQRGSCISGDSESRWSEHGELVLGIGPSKLPSASFVVAAHDETGGGADVHVAVKAAWRSPTEFTLSGVVKGVDKPDLLGAHTLVFP